MKKKYQTLKDLGKATLITAGFVGAAFINSFVQNYNKFGRILPVKSIELQYDKSIESDRIIAKTGRDWNGDGCIDEIITTKQIKKGPIKYYTTSEIQEDSDFYKNIEVESSN